MTNEPRPEPPTLAGLSRTDDRGGRRVLEPEFVKLDTLRRLGCELFQGYLFARPARGFPEVSWPDAP